MKSKGIYISSHASLRVMLTFAELHNRKAYANNGYINPYLYSGTNIYTSGKYVEEVIDGEKKSIYKEDLIDKQIGLYALITSIDEEEWYLDK